MLRAALWMLLLLLFNEIGLPWPFVVLSGFYLIYLFTDSNATKRRPHEKSAYSVFNPNCEAIDGTLSAEQFEKEIR